MRSLFLKVFLWFWLAMALVIGAFLLVTELSRSEEPFPHNVVLDKYTSFIAQTAALTYERDGQTGLASYLQRMERETNHRPRLFDEQGTELSGLGAQAGALLMVRRVMRSGRPALDPPREKFLVAFPALTGSGRTYVFVSEVNPPFGPPPINPWSLLSRILAALLTAGLLCYLLARYIVSPVVKLRSVTMQVAGGDLSARVGPRLGRRRDELADMGRDFDAMAARIESLVTSQRRLLGDISHELRSPLARLSVALELARRRVGAEAGATLDRIEREAESINDMIGQLLTLSRFENGTGGLKSETIDLGALVREVTDDADFEARSRERSVRIAACEACSVTGVAGLLRSAIENVVRNGVRHTAEKTEVEVSLLCEGVDGERHAIITVRDHGAGVPEKALTEIFRPFYRVEEARDRQTGGAGLGLAIAARAMQLHRGTIKAANAPDGGLIVELILPGIERGAATRGFTDHTLT
ncbi:MAG TPA: ATP-binding protein [Pyrinomonadaceae bacterium]|jgi:two-component system sensor histidine kinase CpxA